MKRIAARCRGDVRRVRASHANRPTLEGLEGRLLLYAANGGLWTYGSRITYSFMPDTTNVGGQSSSLFSTLNGSYSTATWERTIAKAFAVWENAAHVNFALVSDNGAADGATGNQQDDPNFGDIRIGATPQASGVLATTFLPPPFNGGTAAGDVILNSSTNWAPSGYDLETVMIHEIGHALGLDHSTASSSAVMYATYNGVKQSLTSDDSAGIQSLYGAVPSDGVSNATFATATNITGNIDGNLQIALSGLAMNGPTDNDFYVVTAPSNTTGTMVVTMQSTNLSSLNPKLVVYNSAQHGLQQVSSTNFGDTITITITGVAANQTYYIRAETATTGPGRVGAYGLLVNFGSQSQGPVAPPNTVVAARPDQGGGSESLTVKTGPNEGWTVIVPDQGGGSESLTVKGLHHRGHWAHHTAAAVVVGGLTGRGAVLHSSANALHHSK